MYAQATMRGENRFTFTNYLRRAMDDQLAQPGEIHRAMAQLKLPFWINATYDNLLARALDANTIVTGEDTRYWKPGHPTVVQLLGHPSRVTDLVIIESDYERLRTNEGDRMMLVSFLRQELSGKVVLFIGFDPTSPDFALLSQYILEQHLGKLPVRAFLAWPNAAAASSWGGHPIYSLDRNHLDLVAELHTPSDNQAE